MPSTTRPPFLLACTAALFACAGGDSASERGPRPNVLLITLDTTRADHLGCYGAQNQATPHLDALAADGAIFERTISTAGITPMSHASILTGLNNYRHGMRVFHSEECSHTLKESVDTLPEILKRQGYATAAMVSAYVVSEIYNLHQGFDTFTTGVETASIDISQQQKHATEWSPTGKTNSQRRGDLTVLDALGWLEGRAQDEAPWFLWVHMFDVHDYSLVPPRDFIAKYDITYPDVGTKFKGRKSHEWRERIYDPELAWMDLQAGKLFEFLRASDQYDDTLVVVTADHGQGLLDGFERHGWAKHRLLYDWCLRVPLLMKIPGEQPHVRVSEQVRTIDIVPTILHKLDVAATQEIEGVTLLPLMWGESEREPRIAYADALNLYDAHSPSARNLPATHHDNLFAVTDGRWKLVWRETAPENSELFDLSADPLESTNLYRTDHEEARRLFAFLEEHQAWEVDPPGEASEEASAGALKGLGYSGD